MPQGLKLYNCCANPDIEQLKTFFDESHEGLWIEKCRHCQCFWLCSFNKKMDFSGGDDDIIISCSKLSEWEAQKYLKIEDFSTFFPKHHEKRETLIKHNRKIIKKNSGNKIKPQADISPFSLEDFRLESLSFHEDGTLFAALLKEEKAVEIGGKAFRVTGMAPVRFYPNGNLFSCIIKDDHAALNSMAIIKLDETGNILQRKGVLDAALTAVDMEILDFFK